MLTGFAEWAAQKAHRQGKKVLWCPMREGELLAELINNAARAHGWDVTARPIWLSRHVASIAAVAEVNTDSIRDFIRRGYRMTVKQMVQVLGMSIGEVPGLAGDLDTAIDNGGIAQKVAVALTETPHLRTRLKANFTEARERLMLSLYQAGAFDNGDITLVDLGWGGTIQHMLGEALKIAGSDIVPEGLYVATDHRAAQVCLAGYPVEGYLAQAGHPHDIATAIVRSPEVFEQSVNAQCGSLIGFTENAEPVLGPFEESVSASNEHKAVQDGIRAFQAQWNRYVVHHRAEWADLTTQQAKDRLANILVSALKSPTAEEAAVFGGWSHEDNFGSSAITNIVPEDLKVALPYLSPADLADFHMRDSFWPALLAASDPGLAVAARALADGHIDASVFESTGEPMESKLYHRTEEGWHSRPASKVRVRINHNGLSFARFRFEHHDTTHVSLALPGRPAIVRVDWIKAEVIAPGGRRVTVRWEGQHDFAGMIYRDCTWLGANVVEFENAESALVLPIADRAGGVVSSGQVTVGFAVLPQSISHLSPHLPAAQKLARYSGRVRHEYLTRGPAGVAAGAARVAMRKLGGLM